MPDEIETYDTMKEGAEEVMEMVPWLQALNTVLTFWGYYNDSDPLAHAVALIKEQLREMLAELGRQNLRLNDVSWALARVDNQRRIDKMEECAREVDALAFELSQQPADIGARARIAHALGAQA